MSDTAAMAADTLNWCIKCRCSFSASDKAAKLLPCLHTMCVECISGRTDVAEKLRKLKEEKEAKEVEKEIKEKIEQDIKEGTQCSGTPADEQESEAKDVTKEGDAVEKEGNVAKDDGTAPETANDSNDDSVQAVKADGGEDKPEEKDKSDQSVEEPKQSEDEEKNAPESDTANTEEEQPAEENAETGDSGDRSTPKPDGVEQTTETEKTSDKEKVEENMSGTEVSSKEENEPMQTTEETSVEEATLPPEPVPLTECPVCREPFNVDNLIDNIFTHKKASAPKDSEGREQKCTGCESNPANSYCMQCDDWLCDDCVTAHKRVKMTKDHQLTSLEEALSSKADSGTPAEVSMQCRVHPKEKLTLFCEKCEVLTCRDCQLLQHQEHKYQFLQEAADSYKAKLTGSLSLMKDRRDVLKRYQTEIEDRLSKVKREKVELQQDILRQADTIVKAVRAAVWSVLSSLHSFTDAAAKRLSREVGDVGDLVSKFDHCISFMDAILEDGFGLPLLFSKTIVETKCRKVYHTHMEPQSLKGQLNIQYRHDVQSVIRSLPSIGAIYINGSKYPPEKSSSQSSAPNSTTNQAGSYRSPPGGGMVAGGGPQAVSMAHHMAPQDRTNYMQMMMSRQTHANTTPSQGPTLSLPGSRRVGNMGRGSESRGWLNQSVPMPGSQAALMAGMLTQAGQQQQQQQQMMTARSASFTPMRLHHRPMEPTHMTPGPPMIISSQHRAPLPHGMTLVPHLAVPPMRTAAGQPHYRGAAEGAHVNSGGQAAMSGIRRPGLLADGSPDPARPASGGHNTPERPLSSEGAASSVRVKSEPAENMDCVITSANFKGKRSPAIAATLGELQKNLDEVIRGVPLDLGDNLEQINGGDLLSSSGSSATTPTAPTTSKTAAHPPPPLVPSTPTSTTASINGSTAAPNPPTLSHAAAENKAKEDAPQSSKGAEQSPASADSHQVKGYATGNSMPGFTLAAVESVDPNDDYCAACHQGGDVLCCDKCPRVFHLQCHVPVLSVVPSGAFMCTLCEEDLMLENNDVPSASGKRKAPTGLSDKDLKVCERILLELFCHPSSIPFHEPVNRAVPNYYKIITNPMDFTNIKCKLSRNHFNHYSSIESFLDDCRLIFKNCAIYNSETSEVGKAGRIVHGYFDRLVDKHMPEYGSYVRRQETPERESERKKRKTTPPPPHGGQLPSSEKSDNEPVHFH